MLDYYINYYFQKKFLKILRRNEVDVAGILDLGGAVFNLGGRLDQADALQPRHGSAGDGDGPPG
jgi:hypothetical protein